MDLTKSLEVKIKASVKTGSLFKDRELLSKVKYSLTYKRVSWSWSTATWVGVEKVSRGLAKGHFNSSVWTA